MKRYFILTSVIALAACGGGSGGGIPAVPSSPSTPTTPTTPVTVTLQGFSGGTTVNSENAGLTNMASYTNTYATDAETSKAQMIAYVNSHLSGSTDLLNRSASTRKSTVRATRDAFADADAAITQMKQVVYDIVNMGDDGAAIDAYVTEHKDAMVNALLLLGQTGVTSDMTNEQLMDKLGDARNAIIADTSNDFSDITSANIMEVLDWFDERFGMTRERMDKVKLRDTGQDAHFKFALDDTGKITSVSLWENAIGEYGSAYTTGANRARIYINNSGNAAYEMGTTVANLNPFGTDADPYMKSDEGDFYRDGNTFSNTVNFYTFNIGGEEMEIVSQTPLTVDEIKVKLKNAVIEDINKVMHSQPGDSQSQDNVIAFTEQANTLFTAINNFDFPVTDGYVTVTETVAQTATMNGLGKGFGSDGSKKLSYADFGYSTLTRTTSEGSESQHLTYAGGYDARRMTPGDTENLLADNSTFTGTAVVTVEDEDRREVANPGGSGTHTEKSFTSALYRDNTAQLKYNIAGSTVTNTLTMANLKAVESSGDNPVATGKDWYTMVISKDEGSNTATYTFDSTDKDIATIHQFYTVDNMGQIRRNEHDTVTVANQIVKTDISGNDINTTNNGTNVGNNFALHGNLEANYYGENQHNPTEATAGFWMSEHYHDGVGGAADTHKHELSVYGVFGGLKD